MTSCPGQEDVIFRPLSSLASEMDRAGGRLVLVGCADDEVPQHELLPPPEGEARPGGELEVVAFDRNISMRLSVTPPLGVREPLEVGEPRCRGTGGAGLRSLFVWQHRHFPPVLQ